MRGGVVTNNIKLANAHNKKADVEFYKHEDSVWKLATLLYYDISMYNNMFLA